MNDTIFKIADVIKMRLARCEGAMITEIGGSIRRGKENPKDIEICVLSKSTKKFQGTDLFGEPIYSMELETPAMSELRRMSNSVVRCGQKSGQFVVASYTVDYFQTTDIDAWGLMYFIRTGPADFVKQCLIRWKQKTGGYSKENILRDSDGTKYPCKNERAVFERLGLPWAEPKDRI